MVENLTGLACEPKNGGDHYFFEADYSRNPDPEYLLAIWDAICGRAGNRLYSIVDEPERHSFLVKLRFSGDIYPEMISTQTNHKPNLEKGNIFCHGDRRVTALQVKSENIGRVLAFIGNGTWEKPKDKPGTLRFINGAAQVFKYAEEGDYVIHQEDNFFIVAKAAEFEKDLKGL